MSRTEGDPLAIALEELRHRSIVEESREYARRWERASARSAKARRTVRARAGAAVAACLLLGALVLWIDPFPSGTVETRVGELRTMALEDGSRIVLDASTRLRVAFTDANRDVELLAGRAHFEVASNPQRPFRVRTASAEVVAVGTMFDVTALPSLTTVTLIEGRVNVRSMSAAATREPRTEALTAGQQIGVASSGQFVGRQEVRLDTATAWQRGTIVLDDVTVAEALATLNRYSKTRIVVTDAALQSRRITGVFRAGDVETEVLALERYFDLTERTRSETQIVLAR